MSNSINERIDNLQNELGIAEFCEDVNERAQVYLQQIMELYSKQNYFQKILLEFDKREREAQDHATQNIETPRTEQQECDAKERELQVEPDVESTADDGESDSVCKVRESS
jgi:hypothetical protein